MPQIQEYLPEVEAQGPVGGVSPNVELAGAQGRGIEQLGAQLGQAADLIHRRNAQAETADVYSTFADKRAQYTDEVQQGVQDGSLDVDKLKEKYDNDTQQLADKIETPEGRNYFERQRARLKGTITHMAANGMAVVAKKNALASVSNGITQNSNAIEQDPNSFTDVMGSAAETVDEYVKNGGLPEAMRGEALKQMGVEYSKAAIRGMAQLGDAGPEMARKAMSDGHFDSYLNSDQKHAMSMEVDHYQRANEAEANRAAMADEKAKKLSSEKWVSDRFDSLQNGSLSTKDITAAVRSGKMNWETGERLVNIVDRNARQELHGDPAVKIDLMRRIADPNATDPIGSVDDLLPYAAQGKINAADLKSLGSVIDMTPEGSAIKMGTKQLFDAAKSIRFKDDIAGGYSSLGNQKYSQFQFDFIAEKKRVKEAGGNVSDLVNPESPLYFGNRIKAYETPLGERYQQTTNKQTQQALGMVPTPTNPNPTPNPKARKPGETPEAYLNRINSGQTQ